MTIVMRMTWAGVTPEQYDEVRRQADWIGNPAEGGDVHVASFDDEGTLHCTDVWRTEMELNQFLMNRVFPIVTSLGITTQPDVTIEQCHEVFVPHLNTITLPEADRVLAATPIY